MTKIGKPRHYPEKRANQYGGDFECFFLEEKPDGTYYCPEATWHVPYGFGISTDKTIREICKGNRHSCIKGKYALLASIKGKKHYPHKKDK